MLNYSFIEQKAKESQIDKVTIFREYWQFLLLQKIYLARGSEQLIFKGGTAIRFLLGSFRFSEDLDFTSTAKKEFGEKIIKETFIYFQKNTQTPMELKKIPFPLKFADESVRYRYLLIPPGSKHKVSIRVDLSFREKPENIEQSILIPFDYPISPYPLVMHFKSHEILAEKIRALFVRGKPRDLFDLWFLLTKKIPIDLKLIKEKFKLYPQSHYSDEKLKNIIKNFDLNELKNDLNQFLPENYRQFYKKLPQQTLLMLP
ncbi:hypothetical protein A3D78_03075 [Candidatus Gottesmanbacteria bacterium RIFCSPHIGHO2_02_FULL_39_14]|uniref:Nucleotidyl transferase AbiEii/AbiGii toxin family protein n=1 Tax=Candidatus Gottesmanbacteria bacterium RIFCSPHIGHO2_02_FULL_39_14 TaxID=1798383 RepID=A0A1F5ZZU8_9BACT|nr:MAG: hypothetical protein A3D78_03075 [Candidatus Gottesmanbacteria bacterium RIFCSPHIGHO2_02_FULL_39_14]